MPNIIYTLAERIEMVRQHEQGLSYRRIVDHFAASYPKRPIPSKSTVQKIVKKFRETGNLDPSLIKVSQPKKQLPEETKLNVCLAIEECGNKPLSKIAQEFHISRSSVHKIAKSHKRRYKPYNVKSHVKHPPPPPSPLSQLPSYNENENLIVPEDIQNMLFDSENLSSEVDFSSSPLHYSLWNYLKTRLYSEGRMGELEALWIRVANVINGLDSEIISKINLALDITPLIKEELCPDTGLDHSSSFSMEFVNVEARMEFLKTEDPDDG